MEGYLVENIMDDGERKIRKHSRGVVMSGKHGEDPLVAYR